jgi:glyoxylase-like metal-dependent hydrolase (beta-lactamase superfamily II)
LDLRADESDHERMWMQLRAVVAVAVAALALATPAAARAAEEAVRVKGEAALAGDMVEAARRFLASLTPAQRQKVRFAADDAERRDWHYIPRARRGVALGALDPAQRHLAYGFLATALSRQGFLKATGIMALEEVLRRRAGNADGLVRDARAYYLTIFGEPSASATWGWRLEGHHLSLNLTLVDGQRPLESPAFLGAAPARVGAGYLAGMRVLGDEEDLGRRLLAALDPVARAQAICDATAPADILTGPGQPLRPLPGLPGSRMDDASRTLLTALVDEALDDLPRELAEHERARLAAFGPAALVFTWAGGMAPGQPHYYRVDGPTFLYEYDNTQEEANHVHTVWHTRDQAAAANARIHGEWSAPVAPFRVIGNVYYVGARNIASYLIATPAGHILLDSGTREMTPQVRASIEKLGFQLGDVKILLSGHAHYDHVQGHAALRAASGAQVMALGDDATALATGVDRSPLGDEGWEPVPVARVLRDGDTVTLGGTTLRATWAPGHTPGCTVWSVRTVEAGQPHTVAFFACAGPNRDVQLVGNPRFPHLVDDTLRGLERLRALTPDVVLLMHPEEQFASKQPLVDAGAWKRILDEVEADVKARAARERAAGPRR